MKKEAIKIGKEVVVDIKEKVKCSSIKKRNGYQNQSFIGIDLPPKIKFQYWETEEINKRQYEKYVSKDFLVESFKISGMQGWEYGIREIDNLCRDFFIGKTANGRRIISSRALKIEDINKIVDLKLNYEKGIIYQREYPFDILGTLSSSKEINVKPFLYKDEEIFYKYQLKDLITSSKIKRMICISKPYILSSSYVFRFTSCKDISVGFFGINKENDIVKNELAIIEGGENINNATRIDLSGYIRPVIFLKKDI